MPLFPNYVFVSVAKKDRWKILSLNGVIRFLTHEGEPCVVPEDVINSLSKIDGIQIETTRQTFNDGDEVEVCNGALMGLKGKLVERNSGKVRVAVRVELMNQSVLLDVDPENLGVTSELLVSVTN